MVSAAKLAWESRMREYGYVPARERVANVFNGIYNFMAGTYNLGKKTCQVGYKVGSDIYSGWKKVQGAGKSIYATIAPAVKEIRDEIKKDRAENAAVDKFADLGKKSKARLEELVAQVQAQASPDCTVEITDAPGRQRNYGNMYEITWDRINSNGMNVPTGVLVDMVNKKFYRY